MFRGVRFGDLDDGRQLNSRAFMLRRPDEFGLSVSEIRINAFRALANLKGTAELNSGQVRILRDRNRDPLGLKVEAFDHQYDPGYAQILNLPAYATEGAAERKRVQDVADLLLEIAAYLHGEPSSDSSVAPATP